MDGFGRRCRLYRFGKRSFFSFCGLVADEFLPIRGEKNSTQGIFVNFGREGNVFHKRFGRTDIENLFIDLFSVHLEPSFCALMFPGCNKSDFNILQGIQFHVYGRLKVSVFDTFDFAYGIPVLFDDPQLIRLKPAVVGLVVRKGAHHKLDIRTIGFGQNSLPHLSPLTRSPGPEFFPGHKVMVGHMHHTRFFAVIVAGQKIVLVVPGKK